MYKRNLKWMLYVIDRLLILEIGDPKRLELIKSKLKNSKTISEDDDNYVFEKLKDLKKLESVSEPRSDEISLPIGKIIGISVLVLIVVGGAYVWLTEISPEIQRVNENNKRIEEQNAQVIQERMSSGLDYDCYYDEQQKVNNCIPR